MEPNAPAPATAAASSLAAPGARGAIEVAAQTREQSELMAALWMATNRPRDEGKSSTAILKSCQRTTFANQAMYSFPRGGNEIAGPSVNLAREIARAWGNIRFGLRVVDETRDTCHIRGFAQDLETGASAEMEDVFAKRIPRKQPDGTLKWIRPDERDLRELRNRRGAICVRNAILQVVPSDIVEEAMRVVKETMQAAARGDLEDDRSGTVEQLLAAFGQFKVYKQHLEDWLGKTLEEITEREVVRLRQIYASIQHGNSEPGDYFVRNEQEPRGAAEEEPRGGVAQTKERLAAAKRQEEAEQPEPEPSRPDPDEPEPPKEPAPPVNDDPQKAAEQAIDSVTESTKPDDSNLDGLWNQLVTLVQRHARVDAETADRFAQWLLAKLKYDRRAIEDENVRRIIRAQVQRQDWTRANP